MDNMVADRCFNEKCGSCGWSMYPYELQLENKLNDINLALKNSKLDIVCKKITESKITSHYRNRMDFVVSYTGEFGLREKGKWWRVLDNHTCFLPDNNIINAFNNAYPWVKEFKNIDFKRKPYFDRKTNEGLLRYIIIRCTATKEIMVNVLTSVPANEAQGELVEKEISKLSGISGITTLVWSTTASKSDISVGENIKVLYGKGYINELIDGRTYIITPNSFFQTNSYTAPVLLDIVMTYVCPNPAEIKNKKAVDLYCGSGFFTIPVSQIIPDTIGVELNASAIEDAITNAKNNNAPAKFLAVSAEGYSLNETKPDILILDPPRSGLHHTVIADIKTALPERIVYVSCNYLKLAEQLAELSDAYVLQDIQAVDMFPHTPHVETIALLEKYR